MAAKDLKQDLDEIHKDWIQLFQTEIDIKNSTFLKKIAQDIVSLDRNALDALQDEKLKEKAELIHFALTTPWGAPFIGETTLLDAALAYQKDNQNLSLIRLLSGFIHHGKERQAALFNVFDDISRDIA